MKLITNNFFATISHKNKIKEINKRNTEYDEDIGKKLEYAVLTIALNWPRGVYLKDSY